MRKNFELPSLGIIGGAGPMAGALLFQTVVKVCQDLYGCQEDAEFPFIMLLNIPFVDMLRHVDRKKVTDQLDVAFQMLERNQIEIAAIACNTLHEFLPIKSTKCFEFIHLIEETALALQQANICLPLVLCSTTSARCQLHQKYFACVYPEDSWQRQLQGLIDKILAGKQSRLDSEELAAQINFRRTKSDEKIGVVLGCTEFSLFESQYSLKDNGLDDVFEIFDPSVILAKQICKSIFNN